MVAMSYVLHHSLETVVVVSLVVHDAFTTIGLRKGVLTLHNISVTNFPMRFVISGVGILDTVFELVLGMGMMFLLVVTVIFSVILGGDNDGQAGNQSDDLLRNLKFQSIRLFDVPLVSQRTYLEHLGSPGWMEALKHYLKKLVED